MALFCQTVYAIKMKILVCPSNQPSTFSLESYTVWIVDTANMRVQISKQIIDTGGGGSGHYCMHGDLIVRSQSRERCWVIIDLWTGLQLRI